MLDLDNPTIPTCPRCGGLPELTAGVTASVRFTADGNATIVIDLDELDAGAAVGDWAFACADDCDEVQGDSPAWTAASADIAAAAADVARNCAPSLDYSIGSGANRG